jgi:hypothetical protein
VTQDGRLGDPSPVADHRDVDQDRDDGDHHGAAVDGHGDEQYRITTTVPTTYSSRPR